MNKNYKLKERGRMAAWIALIAMMLFPLASVAQSIEIPGMKEISGEVKASELGNYVRIKLTGNTVLTVDKDTYLREITGGNYDLEIVTTQELYTQQNQHTYTGKYYGITVDQDYSNTAAVDVKNLTISGKGTTLITGRNIGVYLRGETLTCNNTVAGFSARYWDSDSHASFTCSAITGDRNSNVLINNSDVTISSNRFAFKNFNSDDKMGTFTVKGANSLVSINGSIGYLPAPYEVWSYTSIKEFNVEDGEVTVNNDRCGSTTIYADNVNLTGGKITVNQNGSYSLKNSDAAIHGTTTISNCELNVSANWHGISGHITIDNAKVNVNVGTKSYALKGGNIKITGDQTEVYANGSNGGIYSEIGNIEICCRKVFAKSRADGYFAIWAKKSLKIDLLNQYSNYQAISSNKNPIYAGTGIYMTKACDISFGYNASQGKYTEGASTFERVIPVGSINEITLQSPNIFSLMIPVSTERVYVGETRKINLGAAEERITWDDPEVEFKLIKRASDGTETVIADYGKITLPWETKKIFNASESGHTIAGNFKVDPFYGDVYTSWAYQVVKHDNSQIPVKPELVYRQGSVQLLNPNKTTGSGAGIEGTVDIPQEYLVLSSYKDVSSLTESDWANAETPTYFNQPYKLNKAASNAQLYVYTRYKETNNFYAGKIVSYSSVNTGASGTETKSVRFEASGLNADISIDQDGTYIVPQNTVIKLDELPIPDNATDFVGSAGWAWRLSYGNSRTLYEDAACTKPITRDETHFYKTVYFKATEVTTKYSNIYEVTVDDYRSLNPNILSPYVQFVVVGEDGNVPLLNVRVDNSEYIYVKSGEIKEFPIVIYPATASNQDISFDKFGLYACNGVRNTGTLPGISINNEKKTITVDCSKTEPSFYTTLNLSPLGGVDLYVKAPEQDGITVTPQDMTVAPSATIQLKAEVTPHNAGTVKWNNENHGLDAQFIPATTENVRWESSNTQMATVDENGLVTMNPNAGYIGEEVTIKATSGEFTATSKLTVGGLKYDLWVNGTQVNEYNQTDILGNGTASFQGNTLTLNGVNFTYTGNSIQAIKSTMPDLTIEVIGENTVAVNNVLEAMNVQNVIFTGDGTLNINNLINRMSMALNAKNITVSDNVTVKAKSNNGGGVNSTGLISVTPPNARLESYGIRNIIRAANGINGTVEQPSGGIISRSGTDFVVVGPSGNALERQWVVITGKEADGIHLKGDVNEDTKVNISDIVALINQIAGKAKYRFADVNEDFVVNISDIVAVINIMAGK